MRETVDTVGAFAAEHEIEIDWHKGGTLLVARDQLQLGRAEEHVANERLWGNDGITLLAETKMRQFCNVTSSGGSFNPHCAVINPAKLVIGLANVVEGLGVKIFEQSRVTRIDSRGSNSGSLAAVWVGEYQVKANVVLRATEGYTALLPQAHRDIAPVYSLMIATEPLSAETWRDIGLGNRQTFADYGNLIIYGQRTADGRLAFGGRGAPYHFGSQIKPAFDENLGVHGMLAETLVRWFPALADKHIEYRWGGPLGIPRDWYAGVRFDPATGMGSVGGYVGDGVATSNLAGRTFASLVTNKDADLRKLPWVNRPVRRWEPEPLRWLGINAALTAVRASDWFESRVKSPAPWSPVLEKLTGD